MKTVSDHLRTTEIWKKGRSDDNNWRSILGFDDEDNRKGEELADRIKKLTPKRILSLFSLLPSVRHIRTTSLEKLIKEMKVFPDKLSRDILEFLKKKGSYRCLLRYFNDGIQDVHTPYDLCSEIISKLKEYEPLDDKQILVLFNLEFVSVLIEDFGVNPKNITYASDGVLECELAKKLEVKVIMENINNFFEVFVEESDYSKKIYNILKKTSSEAAAEEYKENTKKVRKVVPKIKRTFDIVVGNPPYQDPINKNKAHPLWVRFLEMSFEMLNPGGTLCFITPDSWRTSNSPALRFFSSKKVKFISFDCGHHFTEGSTFSYYIIQNCNSDGNTTEVLYKEKKYDISLSGVKFLPEIDSIPIVSKMMKHTERFSFVSIGAPFRSDSVSNVSIEKTEQCKNELYHINTQNYFSKKEHPYQKNMKVIVNKTGTWKPFYDSGQIGFTHINLAILVENESDGDFIARYLNSKIVRYYINSMNVFGARDIFTMSEIPRPVDLDNNFVDSDLYHYFNLTPGEVEQVEKSFKK